MTPERRPAPPRTAYLPPLDPLEAGRRQGLALAGEPVEHNIGERLLRMSRDAARAEAERIANQPIPEWKSERLEPTHWAVWADALDRAPEIGPVQRAVYLEIFAAEGGFEPDGATVAGIATTSVPDIAPAIGVPRDTPPAELTVAQLVDSYRAYFDLGYSLGPIGGAATLEAMQDIGAATVLADALFREGATGGAEILRTAINTIDPGRVPEGGRVDQALFDAYVALAADPATRPALGVAVTAVRNEERSDEPDRNRRMGEEMLR